MGKKEALRYFAQMALCELAADVSAVTVVTIGEYNDWPAGLTLLLSLGTGLTVGRIGNQLIFERNGIEILRREIPEGGTVSQDYSALSGAEIDGVLRRGSGGIEGGTETIHNISELSNEQIEALIKYTGDNYANINNSLCGVETLTPENRTTVEAMKSALDNLTLPRDMILCRGTSTEALGPLQNLSVDELVGKTFTEQGFMSASTSNVVAEGFSGNMQMIIEASEGAQALDISSISQYTTEAEVLFNTGQEMLITSAKIKNAILYITVIIE